MIFSIVSKVVWHKIFNFIQLKRNHHLQQRLIDESRFVRAFNRCWLQRFSILKFGRRLKPIERSHEQIWAHTRDWKVYEDRSTNLVRHFDVVECEVKSLRFMFRKFFWPFVARTREEWNKFIERSFGQWTDKRLKCLKKSNKCRCNLKMVMRELNWLKDLGFGINAV